MRTFSVSVSLAACLVLAVTANQLEAQGRARSRPKETRFELTPFAGYQWGGSFDTQAGGAVPAGQLKESDTFSWGVILSFTPQPQTAVELTYLAQLGPWLAVQPDLQYVIAPGGIRGTPNALVLGLRVAASL